MVLPAEALGPELAPLAADLPGVRYLAFGFGERAWLLTREHGVGDALSALLPGPGALLVTALAVPPEVAFGEAATLELLVPAAGIDRLRRFLRESLGGTAPIATGPYLGSRFYEATPRYAATYTCNTWTAEALREAGVPVSPAGVLFAFQLRALAQR